jgi:hypothetical protein
LRGGWRDSHGTLYVVVARRSENGSLECGDGALHRLPMAPNIGAAVARGLNGPNGLAIDPKDPNRLYLAAWGQEVEKKA